MAQAAANAEIAGGVAEREQIPDCVLMYACIFTYEKAKIRGEIGTFKVNSDNIRQYEGRYQARHIFVDL